MLGLRCMNPVRSQSWRKLWEPLAYGRWHGVRALGWLGSPFRAPSRLWCLLLSALDVAGDSGVCSGRPPALPGLLGPP